MDKDNIINGIVSGQIPPEEGVKMLMGIGATQQQAVEMVKMAVNANSPMIPPQPQAPPQPTRRPQTIARTPIPAHPQMTQPAAGLNRGGRAMIHNAVSRYMNRGGRV